MMGAGGRTVTELSTPRKEVTVASCVMQSFHNELSSQVYDSAKCKEMPIFHTY